MHRTKKTIYHNTPIFWITSTEWTFQNQSSTRKTVKNLGADVKTYNKHDWNEGSLQNLEKSLDFIHIQKSKWWYVAVPLKQHGTHSCYLMDLGKKTSCLLAMLHILFCIFIIKITEILERYSERYSVLDLQVIDDWLYGLENLLMKFAFHCLNIHHNHVRE